MNFSLRPLARSSTSQLGTPPARQTLEVGAIYCGLFVRSSVEGPFHWTLLIARDTESARKLHAVELEGGYMFKKGEQSLFKSATIVLALKIGQTTEENNIAKIEEITKEVAMQLPPWLVECGETEFDCRTWVLDAIFTLHGHGILNCPDMAALQGEILSQAMTNLAPCVRGRPFELLRVARNSS